MKRGDVLTFAAGEYLWYRKTREELEAQRAYDVSRGYTMTDDGETVLYCSQGTLSCKEPTTVLVTALRGADWAHDWRKKPARLTSGVITSGPFTGREVSFVRPSGRRTKCGVTR